MGQATSKVVGTYSRNHLTLSDLFPVILECSFVYLYISIEDSDIIQIILHLMQRVYYEEMVRISLQDTTDFSQSNPYFYMTSLIKKTKSQRKNEYYKQLGYECMICHNLAFYRDLRTDIVFCGKDCQSIYYELFRDIYKPLI